MYKSNLLTFFFTFALFSCASATEFRDSQGSQASLEAFLKGVPKGSILVLGEAHNFEPHQRGQVEIMKSLRDLGHKIDVGMEFLEYPTQTETQAYRAGELGEEDYKTKIKWGSFPFELYKEQILFPSARDGENTWAINAPRSLTSRVSKVGIAGLTEEEKSLLPPDFKLGNAMYFERFVEAVPHLPPGASERYFAAQSIWDDTMAWKAGQAAQEHTLVIVVGEFHVQYGGGLPDRLKARYPGRVVKTLSMIKASDYEEGSLESQIQPHPKYGPRADLIRVD